MGWSCDERIVPRRWRQATLRRVLHAFPGCGNGRRRGPWPGSAGARVLPEDSSKRSGRIRRQPFWITWNPGMVQETAGRRCVEAAVVDLLGPRSGVSTAADNVGNKADLGRSTRGLVPATSWVVGVGATVHFARVAGNGPIWWPRCGWPTGRNAEGARTAWARHAAGSGE